MSRDAAAPTTPTHEPEFISLRHRDGYEAAARWWPPGAAPARGAVLYLHGIQSHGQWFEASAARLAEAGFAVLMPDRRGSGRNRVDRGHAESAEQLLHDADDALDELRRRAGTTDVHLVGVSWGGKLALNLVPRHEGAFRSLTLVAPGLFPTVDLSTGQKVRVALSALASRHQRYPIPITEPEMFTANPVRLEFIRNDPLMLRDVTAPFLLASRRLDRFTRQAHTRRGLPAHLLLAGNDRIIDNARTRTWLRELGWPGRAVTEYRQAHHTLEFEPPGCTYVDDLIRFIATGQAG